MVVEDVRPAQMMSDHMRFDRHNHASVGRVSIELYRELQQGLPEEVIECPARIDHENDGLDLSEHTDRRPSSCRVGTWPWFPDPRSCALWFQTAVEDMEGESWRCDGYCQAVSM